VEAWGDCNGFYVCVCLGLYRKYNISRAALSGLVVWGGVVNELVVFKSLSPYRFDVSVFGFGEVNVLWVSW